jgi:hypothetical protein
VTEPFDFHRAWQAHEDAAREQAAAEDEIGRANRAYAQAEEAYRKALALEMWRLRKQSVAWTALGDLARGEERVATLKRARDAAEGDRTIANHAAYRRSADRRDVERFIAWSQARDLAEGYGRRPEPDVDQAIAVFGGSRAT